MNLRMTAFGVRGRRAVLPLAARDDPQCVVTQRPPRAPDVYVSSAGSSSHSRRHRVSSFRRLPRIASAPIFEECVPKRPPRLAEIPAGLRHRPGRDATMVSPRW